MKVDVVVVTYNNAGTAAQCLQSLPKDARIVVVDNASQDDTVATLATLGVAPHSQSKNLGFAAGANQGATLGQSPCILFLNPDAYLKEPSLETALTYLESHPDVAALGFQLVDPTGKPEVSFGPPVTLFSLFTHRRRRPEIPSTPTPVGWVS
ncbi:MAG: glycosyltransferase, partial [Patescibacteria group bacterium]